MSGFLFWLSTCCSLLLLNLPQAHPPSSSRNFKPPPSIFSTLLQLHVRIQASSRVGALVRIQASSCFGALVALLPLAQGAPTPAGLDDAQMQTVQQDTAFLMQVCMCVCAHAKCDGGWRGGTTHGCRQFSRPLHSSCGCCMHAYMWLLAQGCVGVGVGVNVLNL
eukprot:519300-Pelagomonas_calceolata.AAC.1